MTFTTVSPLTVVWNMVKPGVPPNAGLFITGRIQGAQNVAKPIRKKDQKHRSLVSEPLPLGRENYFILGAGILVIVAGYLAMLEGGVEGFLPLVLSPILLVTGYCVVIPVGIMYRKSAPKAAEVALPGEPPKQG